MWSALGLSILRYPLPVYAWAHDWMGRFFGVGSGQPPQFRLLPGLPFDGRVTCGSTVTISRHGQDHSRLFSPLRPQYMETNYGGEQGGAIPHPPGICDWAIGLPPPQGWSQITLYIERSSFSILAFLMLELIEMVCLKIPIGISFGFVINSFLFIQFTSVLPYFCLSAALFIDIIMAF